MIGELVDALESEEKTSAVASSFAPVLQNRLTWLSEKVQAMGKASGADIQSQLEIDKLLPAFQA